MTSKDWSLNGMDWKGTPFTRAYYHHDSFSTKLPSGRINFRAQNYFYMYFADTPVFQQRPTTRGSNTAAHLPQTAGGMAPPPGWSWTSTNNAALAKFNGKVRKGSASLGVTLASWKQSRDMIVTRANQGAKALDRAYDSLKGRPKYLRQLSKEKEPLANQVLETEFGWMPLISDIKAALTTVCQEGVPPEWVGSRHTTKVGYSQRTGTSERHVKNWSGFATTRIVANVNITNPNLWLMNRMGFLNPATVMLDLVPWSFLVNMFVNANAMINAVTQNVGLSLTNVSTTNSMLITCDHSVYTEPGSDGVSYPGPASSTCLLRTKQRNVGVMPKTEWEVRVPELNWELAAIASSLLLQKAQRINNLIRLF